MAKRGRPAYEVPELPEEEAEALRESVGEILRETVEVDGKCAYKHHPLQVVAIIRAECYRLMEEWRQQGSEDWQKFFRQAGDRCGFVLPDSAKKNDTNFLKPTEIWPSEITSPDET